MYNKVKPCMFRPAGRIRDALARPISSPLGSPDGELTGYPPVVTVVRALAPRRERRALKVEQIESVVRVTPPAPRCRAGDVRPALRDRHLRNKNVQCIPFIYPMDSDLLCDSSRNTPHVDVVTRELHPCMCTHHAAAGSTQGGCRYVTTHGVPLSYVFIYATSRAQQYYALFA